jgi:cyclic pyranopterin phosphate synthase
MLEDDFGRDVRGVRMSLTDRCNFDCVYCHNEGLGDTRGPMDPQGEEMTADEVVRFLRVVREFDVERVKFTGGEPMLRADLEEIVRRTPEGIKPSLTTNGSYLAGRAEALKEAGLERVNVSLDARDRAAFQAITQSGAYDRVLEGVDAAVNADLTPVKLNMVVFEETVQHVPEMVEYVSEREGIRLQLIEYMPELVGHSEVRVDMERIHDWMRERADRIEVRDMHHRNRYYINGATIEIVDPVENEDFCANCHRVRVTPDGKLKGCLNRTDDLRPMGEMDEDTIRALFRETVENRVPYYGEYMVRDETGEWVRNENYETHEQPGTPVDVPPVIVEDD